MKKLRILSLLMALLMVLPLIVACSGGGDGETTPGTEAPTDAPVVYQPIDEADAVAHKDFTSVYEAIGADVTIDQVVEDEQGLAYVTVDDVKYELGMDFLSMAMVYNVAVPENHDKYKTADDVYNEWYKLYLQRWNYLAPEVPLYSNQYFDLYNAKISDFETTPYWGPADAIVAAKSTDGKVILGSATDLGGAFRNSSWGKSNPAASDLDIQNLTSGHSTMMTDKTGAYIWNNVVLAETPTSVFNADGSATYTVKIKQGLKFSDGSAVTAKNYIAGLLSNSTAVGVAAGGSGNSGMYMVGFEKFKAYEGTGEKVYFEGVKLIDDYTFSVTIKAEYANYYYAYTYAALSPDPLALYLGDAEIIVDEETKACGLSDSYYAKEKVNGVDTYKLAAVIKANMEWDSGLPYSGPYVVKNYDEATLVATLELNPNYPGDDARGKASIQTITYVKVVTETQMDQFTKGQVDVIAGITGATETNAALKVVNDNPAKYKETHYDRAGYGKIGFRADFGPTAFTSVRQAIMYTINRSEFAQTFTGGYGAVVHGPYYTKFSAFKAVEDDIKLNPYAYSTDSAIAVLEEGGWIYNVEGKAFDAAKDAIRYKKLEGYELTKENINFATTDSKYKTVKIDGAYYMPLAINYYGTQPNDVTDQLLTAWAENTTMTKAIGMYIVYTSTDFMTGLYGELSRMEDYGYNGTPKLNAINFATGFTSALYDYSWNWTINPELYDAYSVCYVLDEADFFENYTK